jgi:protein transport protein SEC61 subunit alpha
MAPIMPLIPTVTRPEQAVSIKQKTIYTAVALFIYLVCCQIPIYGVRRASTPDSTMYWIRMLMASTRGSLMEMGISPALTAGWLMFLASSTGVIRSDGSRQGRQRYESAEVLLGLMITFGESVSYVYNGYFGSVEELGPALAMAIWLQVFIGGVVVVYLDQLLEHGYGVGSGISLFIALRSCEYVFVAAFSPITIKSDAGTEFYGSVVALFHFVLVKADLRTGLHRAFFRQSAPNLTQLISTFAIALLLIYVYRFKLIIRMRNQKMMGRDFDYEIKMFFTNTIPVILMSMLVENIQWFSYLLYSRFQHHFLVRFIGKWEISSKHGHSVPIGGLSYYINLPQDLPELTEDPVRAVISILLIMALCAYCSHLWMTTTAEKPEKLAISFRDNGFVLE